MSVSMRCPSCDTFVNAGDRECWLCHSRLDTPAVAPVGPSPEAPPAAPDAPAVRTTPPAVPAAPDAKPVRDTSMINKAPRPPVAPSPARAAASPAPAAASAQPTTRVLKGDSVSRHGLVLLIAICLVAAGAAVAFGMSVLNSGGSGPASQSAQNATATAMVASLDDLPANWSVEVRRASQGPVMQFDFLGQIRHCATPNETKLVGGDGDHTSVTYNDETGANLLISDVSVRVDQAQAQAFMRVAGATCYPAAVGEIVAGPRGEAALAVSPLAAPRLGDEVNAFRVAQNGITVDDVVIRHGRAVEQLVFRSTGAPISDADRNAIVQNVDHRMVAALRG